MDFISKLFDLHKIPTKIALLLATISGILLFNPFDLIVTLQLGEFVAENGKYVGIAFLLSTGLVIVNSLIWVGKTSKEYIIKIRNRKRLIVRLRNYLDRLDDNEKSVLREFTIQGSNTIQLPIEDPSVVGLIREDVITIVGSSEFDIIGYLAPCIISEEAAEILTPTILDIPIKPTEADKVRIGNSRPAFSSRLSYRKWLRS
jgi:hypothetical protein